MKPDYIVLGTNDMEASVRFYEALFEKTDLAIVHATDRMTFWQCGNHGADFAFAVAKPFDGQPATTGNGSMIGFSVASPEEVKSLHKRMIELGGTCEGEPGQRGPRFSAYARDLDGNKIAFFV
jgi:catechol 2,3-dioxygenase-like lactoylglutathione lyase family enzyme